MSCDSVNLQTPMAVKMLMDLYAKGIPIEAKLPPYQRKVLRKFHEMGLIEAKGVPTPLEIGAFWTLTPAGKRVKNRFTSTSFSPNDDNPCCEINVENSTIPLLDGRTINEIGKIVRREIVRREMERHSESKEQSEPKEPRKLIVEKSNGSVYAYTESHEHYERIESADTRSKGRKIETSELDNECDLSYYPPQLATSFLN